MGSLCISAEFPITVILQLETRSLSIGNRCVPSDMDRSQLYLSPLLHDSEDSIAGEETEGRAGSNISILEDAELVLLSSRTLL